MRKIFKAFAVAVLAATLASCAVNPYTGEQQASKSGVGAGIGAVGGALIGSAIGNTQGALIGAAIGGIGGAAIGNTIDKQDAELRQRLVGTGVQVVRSGNGIQLSMSSDVTFKLDSADINSSFYSTLDSATVVLKKYTSTNVVVSGYTDSTGTVEHNQILSENRAASVGNYLISRGVASNRVFTQGFGKRNPIASNANASGRAMNRRVVITLRPR